jgi:ClpP class serine protease
VQHQGPTVRLTAENLAKVSASRVLALDPVCLTAGVHVAAEPPTTPDPTSDGVAVLRVDGPLAQREHAESLCGHVDGYDGITERFAAALSDVRASSVVLVIDSPGGDAAGLEEALTRMAAAKKAAGKPVHIYIDELAASAAYWIASAVGDSITVPTAGGVGSIGCVAGLIDESAMLEKEGIAVELVRDPEGKAAGHPAAPLMDIARERLSKEVSAIAMRFAKSVAASRGLSVGEVRDQNANVYYGREAVVAGLADKVGTLEQTIAAAARAGRAARKEREKMSLKQYLGLADDATDEQIEAAKAERGKRLALAEHVLTITEADSPEAARGAVDAWQLSAKMAAEDAERRRIEEEEQAAGRKMEHGRALVAECGFEPSVVWANTKTATSADDLELAEPFASMAEPALGAFVATLKAQPRVQRQEEKTKPAEGTAAGLTPAQMRICKETGCTPEKFQQLRSQRDAALTR